MVSSCSEPSRTSGGSVPCSPPVPESDKRSSHGRSVAMSVRSLEVVDMALRDAEDSNQAELRERHHAGGLFATGGRAYPQAVVDAAVAASTENDAIFSNQQLNFSEHFRQ